MKKIDIPGDGPGPRLNPTISVDMPLSCESSSEDAGSLSSSAAAGGTVVHLVARGSVPARRRPTTGIQVTRLNARLWPVRDAAYPRVAENYTEARSSRWRERSSSWRHHAGADDRRGPRGPESIGADPHQRHVGRRYLQRDPKKDPAAVRYERLTPEGLLAIITREDGWRNTVLDIGPEGRAVRIPLWFDGRDPRTSYRDRGGASVGTIVSEELCRPDPPSVTIFAGLSNV